MKLAIDLYAGLGGWADGLLAAGFDVVGFDTERHEYGEHRYPGRLVLQDVRTLHGRQFRDAALIVASPPCQFFSYTAMPWSLAKERAERTRNDPVLLAKELELFKTCFRIQREASAAAGRHVPMVVENVKGAQPWVGRARWAYGSFYLWGDVPALMPIVRRGFKSSGLNWSDRERRGQDFTRVAGNQAMKNAGGSWFNVAHNTTSGKARNPDGRKQPGLAGVRSNGKGDRWFQDGAARHGSKSSKRKAASALIAKIPFELARHVGEVYR